MVGVMQIWGHRGALHYAPENTIASFQKAIELGADGVEFDVQLTKDGKVVVVHDETIDRVSTGNGYVSDYTLTELRYFNFNKRGISEPRYMQIPTLDEVLQLIALTHLEINIEFKTGILFYEGIEEKTTDLVKQYNLSDRVIYSSFNHFSVHKAKTFDPKSRTALICGGEVIVTGEQCEKIGAYALHPSVQHMHYPGLIEDCHKRGIKVNVWTVDNEGDFCFATEQGVDGIFVNDLVRFKKR
jgi:glycerophosphoryl diester phosphodiesterase